MLNFLEDAFLQLSFAIKLWDFLQRYPDRIPLEEFDIELFVGNDVRRRDLIHLKSNQFNTYDDLVLASQNNVLICVGAAAITLHESLQDAYKKPTKLNTDEEKLAGLIYMIRCCYAHNMAEPKWEIRNQIYKTIYTAGNKQIDLRNVHGQSFTLESVGGYETLWFIKDTVTKKNMV